MFPDPLRSFQKVVQTGSIRKASEVLGLAPSSVSRQIAILERQVGTALFVRTVSGITLTNAGSIVAEYAGGVVSGFDTLRIDLDDLKGNSRLIKVAMVESVASIGPAIAAARLRQKFAGVSFEFHIEPAPAVVEFVRQQRCDIGISFCRDAESDISIIAQIAEPILAVVPVDHPIAHLPAITLAQLKEEALALPDGTFGVRRIFDRACAQAGIDIRPMLQTNSFEVLRDFARSSCGIAILPARAARWEKEADRVRCLRIDHPAFSESTLDIVVLKQQRIPRLTRLFTEMLKSALEE